VTIARNQQGHLTYGEIYFNDNGEARLNRSGPNLSIALPDGLQPFAQQWKAGAASQIQPNHE
jgi:hypothetical protein